MSSANPPGKTLLNSLSKKYKSATWKIVKSYEEGKELKIVSLPGKDMVETGVELLKEVMKNLL